jgi:hypothetical protein
VTGIALEYSQNVDGTSAAGGNASQMQWQVEETPVKIAPKSEKPGVTPRKKYKVFTPHKSDKPLTKFAPFSFSHVVACMSTGQPFYMAYF